MGLHQHGQSIVYIFLILFEAACASSVITDFYHCEKLVKKWASHSLNQEAKQDKHTLGDLLFFLHIPRTGGRSYYHCFLKKLYSDSEECPRSYDKLRIDRSKQKCRLLVTHNDYSTTLKLHKGTSLVTVLRNPIDRVISMYEFSIEVAARFLAFRNLRIALKSSTLLKSKIEVTTLDIWPWKYLVPWMREDLFARRDYRKLKHLNVSGSSSPYSSGEIVMPLHDYIMDPVAKDIIHNGATLQVAGLTNNSYDPDAHIVRHCIQKHEALGHHVLEVAKKRLSEMLYVGITEEHKKSVTMFANIVGTQVISQSAPPEADAADGPVSSNYVHIPSNVDTGYVSVPQKSERGNMTMERLMRVYELCILKLHKSQKRRHALSMKGISPLNFSKPDRRRIPNAIVEEIRSLNKLDLELYQFARKIFSTQDGQIAKTPMATSTDRDFRTTGVSAPWRIVPSALPLLLITVLTFITLNLRKRVPRTRR